MGEEAGSGGGGPSNGAVASVNPRSGDSRNEASVNKSERADGGMDQRRCTATDECRPAVASGWGVDGGTGTDARGSIRCWDRNPDIGRGDEPASRLGGSGGGLEEIVKRGDGATSAERASDGLREDLFCINSRAT